VNYALLYDEMIFKDGGIMNYLDNINTSLLKKNLDGLWMRQNITMENIANYTTPGYKSKYVDFEHALQNKLSGFEGTVKQSDIINAAKESEIIIGENVNKTMRLDGNNVDIDSENIELARTQLNYSYTISELQSYMSRMSKAINGGK